MNNTEIIKLSHKLINCIEDNIKEYVDIYLQYTKQEIDAYQMGDKMKEKLTKYTRKELIEFNEMCKMLSTNNCGAREYHTGRIMHEEIMKILYPEDYMVLDKIVK